MPTIQAQDVVNAVIRDSQNQTTNRGALYDYTDRIQQRILRESQWRFLLSDPKTFVTMPGVRDYTLVSGSTPPGSFQTPLNLTDFNNISPGSVYDLSTWNKIEEDSDNSGVLSFIINRDGSARTGQPRMYRNSIANPGTISLIPIPDAQNLYYPIPETPVVNFAPLAGCTLPSRTYFGVVTLVDSLGGESSPCSIPFCVSVPAGNVLTVESPDPVPGGMSGSQAQYNSWNLYIGFSVGSYYIQNVEPIAIGTNWTELSVGVFQGQFPIPSLVNIPFNTYLSINNTGFLTTATSPSNTNPPFPYALVDTNNVWWELISTPELHTQQITPSEGVKGVESIFLTDTDNISTWAITVMTDGLLQATVAATPPSTVTFNQNPPLTSTIQPLNAYVIQFRYYKTRNQIVNPTDVLQIPYAYKDIVIAGVNHLANMYMDQAANREPSAKTLMWENLFKQGLSQIRRDLRVSYRKTDFIAPDIATQYVVGNQQGIPTMGW